MGEKQSLDKTLRGSDWKSSAEGCSQDDLERGYSDADPRKDTKEAFPSDTNGGVYPAGPLAGMHDEGFVGRPKYRSDVERS